MKRFLPILLIAFFLPACTLSDVFQKIGLASDAIDMYTAEQLAAKRAFRAKTREIVFAAVNKLSAQGLHQEAIDFLKANKPYFGQVLLDAEELKQKIRELRDGT